MGSPDTARAPSWHQRPAGLQRVRLRRTGPLAPDGPYAVVDVETTGLDPTTDRIVEVAVVRCDASGRVLSEWSSLVQPDRDPGPTGVHGITTDDLATAPRFAELAGQLSALLEGTVVTAHNLAFDSRFLDEEWRRTGSALPPVPGLCTLALDRALNPGRPDGYSLAACAAAAGVDQPDAHRALADARVTAGLLAVAAGLAATGPPPLAPQAPPTPLRRGPSAVTPPWHDAPTGLAITRVRRTSRSPADRAWRKVPHP